MVNEEIEKINAAYIDIMQNHSSDRFAEENRRYDNMVAQLLTSMAAYKFCVIYKKDPKDLGKKFYQLVAEIKTLWNITPKT